MKNYENTIDAHGERGPFQAESKEALADEMHAIFQTWADDTVQNTENCEKNSEELAAQYRVEFIDGLVEV